MPLLILNWKHEGGQISVTKMPLTVLTTQRLEI